MIGVSQAIRGWQKSSRSQSNAENAVVQEFGEPLLNYIHTLNPQSHAEMKEAIRHEMTIWREQRTEGGSRPQSRVESSWNAFYEIFSRAIQEETSMSMCVTKAGRLGWVPDVAVEGDVIAIVALDVPLILRPCSDGLYLLVGEAFIHGTMQGELVEDVESFDRIRII